MIIQLLKGNVKGENKIWNIKIKAITAESKYNSTVIALIIYQL